MSLPWPFGKGGGRHSNEAKRNTTKDTSEEAAAYLEEFGLTQQLCDFVKGFTISTFKDFPLQENHGVDGSAQSAAVAGKDLTEWQERHATLILSKVKELSQLRYVMCPRHLKEKQFWRIYFLLVKSHVSPYEIRSLQKAKIRKDSQNVKSEDKPVIEVEMTDAKHATASSVTLQCDSEPA